MTDELEGMILDNKLKQLQQAQTKSTGLNGWKWEHLTIIIMAAIIVIFITLLIIKLMSK